MAKEPSSNDDSFMNNIEEFNVAQSPEDPHLRAISVSKQMTQPFLSIVNSTPLIFKTFKPNS
jgi:hypothetical protein